MIPTYSDAIEEEMFVPTSKMEEIANQQPFGWEYLLFAQALKDDSSFLRKYRNQTPDNPFVKAIGNDSEGEKYTEYLRSMLAQTLLETSRLESKFSLYLSHLDEAMGAEGEDGDTHLAHVIPSCTRFCPSRILFCSF